MLAGVQRVFVLSLTETVTRTLAYVAYCPCVSSMSASAIVSDEGKTESYQCKCVIYNGKSTSKYIILKPPCCFHCPLPKSHAQFDPCAFMECFDSPLPS